MAYLLGSVMLPEARKKFSHGHRKNKKARLAFVLKHWWPDVNMPPYEIPNTPLSD